MPAFTIRPLRSSDRAAWFALRTALWPDCLQPDNERDAGIFSTNPHRYAVFVCDSAGTLSGFLEASLRDYADGCSTSPVGYVEGWYVTPAHRRMGIGRALVAAAEDWARSRGCTEMASDTHLHNTGSQQAHQRLGYSEVERLVLFRKSL